MSYGIWIGARSFVLVSPIIPVRYLRPPWVAFLRAGVPVTLSSLTDSHYSSFPCRVHRCYLSLPLLIPKCAPVRGNRLT